MLMNNLMDWAMAEWGWVGFGGRSQKTVHGVAVFIVRLNRWGTQPGKYV